MRTLPSRLFRLAFQRELWRALKFLKSPRCMYLSAPWTMELICPGFTGMAGVSETKDAASFSSAASTAITPESVMRIVTTANPKDLAFKYPSDCLTPHVQPLRSDKCASSSNDFRAHLKLHCLYVSSYVPNFGVNALPAEG